MQTDERARQDFEDHKNAIRSLSFRELAPCLTYISEIWEGDQARAWLERAWQIEETLSQL